jgi:Flp pilus assembly protein TadD
MKTAQFAAMPTALALALATGLGSGAQAQDVVSREVVQPLPAPEVQRLNRALVALAKTPRDRDALLEAGDAAMGVDDLEAAIGFFGRAAEIDANHPKVAQGLGGVYLRAGRAGEALVQFERAISAGVPERDILADQGLSLDLVGEQAAAQQAYRRVIELDPGNDEARRRLAISHAISGNRSRFEETLRPLLDKRDMAAQRARAFGLAILGEPDRASAIVEQVMPRDLATRLTPYFGYMPRLTKPQQAAAANLGLFPRAADIGRDDPRLARFAREERADSKLAPAGIPLDVRTAPPPTLADLARARAATVAPAATPTPTPTAPAPIPASARNAPPSTLADLAPARVAPAVTLTPAPTVPATVAAPARTAPPATLADLTPVRTVPVPAPAASPPPPPPPPPVQAPAASQRVADAFADFGSVPLPDARAGSDAVDLNRITIRREAPPPPPEKPKPKEPPKPVHPSRVWVQVATGKNVSALGFDWRRIAKTGGDALGGVKPHTTRWGEANRLLAGPYTTRDKAQAAVRALKAKGVDSFLYVSPEGEEIQPVK